jgi:uncharacterized protein (TIGR00375 family)
MQIVTDLHLHSKYSRAVSPQMIPPVMAKFGKEKGIDVLSTGDWTHPLWFREIRSYLTEAEEGLYKIREATEENEKTRFLLSVEIACIYSQGGKGRRIHNLVLSPSFEVCEKVNKELLQRGYNLTSDGRPIIGLSSKNLLSLILEVDERCMLIPCHIWTPWFGMYGQASGFGSLQESFEELTPYIYAIETGLSSDPEMNWQIKELDTRSIVSFSDAHSPAKMGREATVFDLESLNYENIRQALMAPSQNQELRIKNQGNKVLYTIEFYPEEGKYHYSGHRNCNVTMTPEEQRATNGICPVCHRHVTDGVMRRVQELATEEPRAKSKLNDRELKWFTDPRGMHPPYVKIVPLNEIIAEAIGSPVASPKVKVIFEALCKSLKSELFILLKAPMEEIKKVLSAQPFNPSQGQRIAEGIQKVRGGNIVIKPGYDGVYGVVKIWHEEEQDTKKKQESIPQKEQLGLEL